MSTYTEYLLQKEQAERQVSTLRRVILENFVEPLTRKLAKEIMMSELNDYREFDLEHAKAGAPVKLRDGTTARIVAFDIKTTYSNNHICVAVIHEAMNGKTYEGIGIRDNNGKLPGSYNENLVMAPLAYVEDKPVFVGDKLQYKCYKEGNWDQVVITPDFRPNTRYTYRWPVESFMYKGRELTMDSEIWYTAYTPGHPECFWVKKPINALFRDIERAKTRLVEKYALFHMHYEWERPPMLEGKPVDKMSVLWHNPSVGASRNSFWIKVNANDLYQGLAHYEHLRSSMMEQFYRWEEPRESKVKKEVWQAVYKSKVGRGKEYGSIHYSSEKDCRESCRDDDGFINAEKTDEYYE